MDGQLLYRGYVHSDTLSFDLYGYAPDESGAGFEVVRATKPSDGWDITELLSREQLIEMGEWLDRNVQIDRSNARLHRFQLQQVLAYERQTDRVQA